MHPRIDDHGSSRKAALSWSLPRQEKPWKKIALQLLTGVGFHGEGGLHLVMISTFRELSLFQLAK